MDGGASGPRQAPTTAVRTAVDAKLVALFHCGGCPATSPVLRMVQMRDWMKPMGQTVDVLHVGTCVMNHCEYKDKLLDAVFNKAGTEVVEGTHPYVPIDVFGA